MMLPQNVAHVLHMHSNCSTFSHQEHMVGLPYSHSQCYSLGKIFVTLPSEDSHGLRPMAKRSLVPDAALPLHR